MTDKAGECDARSRIRENSEAASRIGGRILTNSATTTQIGIGKKFNRHGLAFVCFLALLSLVAGLGCGNGSEPSAVEHAPAKVTTKSGAVMVQMPAGFFQMGNKRGRDDEKPVHKVMIDSFFMDQYEVTQAEFEKLGKSEALANPSHFKGPDLPVEQVNWPLAARFCNARSRYEGLQPCYNEDTGECNFDATGYRLPTEAEWEYACRAGTDGDYSFGNDPRKLGDYAWFADNSGKQTHPVGQKKPNAWGLYDMHGNVAEWCQDIYDKAGYQASADKNPRGPADGKEYVLRGGSWKSTADPLRSAYRLGETAGFSDACLARDAIGFRCVRANEKHDPP
jgi:formylglycine-generating enzyme required for sulfatase activity